MTSSRGNPEIDLKEQVHDFGRRARAASRQLSQLSSEQKNAGLLAMADEIVARVATILTANEKDLVHAREQQLAAAMIDRLTLSAARVEAMAQGIRQVAALPDPVGEILREWTPPNGICISKVRVPIGVVGIIYESRPNVTSDAAVLCTKTGNATILRGGSESIHSNLAIAEALRAGATRAGLPNDSILLIPRTDREAVRLMAEMDRYIDMIVPRGGKALIDAVVSAARMPVIKHSDGICIAYVDREADLEMALEIVFNGKTQRPGVCNALETVLVHRAVAPAFLCLLAPRFMQKKVELRADASAFTELTQLGYQPLRRATEEDWRTEFLDYILALRVVDSPNEAIAHVGEFGSHHSDCIVTRDAETAERFLREVDSATVYWNASTRFTDGGEFGFGAEIGISTDKLHARGPMGLEELTTYKYIIRGTGQTRK
ncbi:MAG: glutamate-5-semialdehyde dehydrogenase [Chthoniobacterales bacterium]